MTVFSSTRSPSSGAILRLRSTSSSTGRSVDSSTSPCAGWECRVSRPYRPIVSATSTSSACGTGKRL